MSETRPERPRTPFRSHLLWLAPLLALAAGFGASAAGLSQPAAITLGIAILTALWWIFEPIPIPATSLVPLALLPLFGILDSSEVAKSYGHYLVLLLLGGFLISKAMEKSGAHRRIALRLVNLCGGSGGKPLFLGFIVASAGLSMWISNTATTLMMLPIAIAVLDAADDDSLRVRLLLAIAFAANIGGMGTPIGTPPNLVFIKEYKAATGVEMTFGGWMKVSLPIVGCLVLVLWLWLTRGIKSKTKIPLPHPGFWRPEEKRTMIIFGLTALAWITRKEPFGGWSKALHLPDANDASVALVAAVLLFAIPNGMKAGGRLLDWKTAVTIPWGMLVLVGSGICLGAGFKASGLSNEIAGLLTGLETAPTILLILAVALVVTFLTEMTSNTATTNILMPILSAAAAASNLDPALLMLPAVFSASCAFMLPVATIPNAVVFGTGHIPIRRMVREGIVLNLFGAVTISVICYFLVA